MDGLILAGGKSTRMGGKHKGSLRCCGMSFTQCLVREFQKEAETVWLSYADEIYGICEGCRIVTDVYPGCGPIGGIHAGLSVCKRNILMVAACDTPLLKAEFFQYLYGKLEEREKAGGICDGAVPVADGREHPLAAIYRKSAAGILEVQIKHGDYRLRDALKKMNILYVDISENAKYAGMLCNVNTPEEYEELLHRKAEI